MGAEDILRTRQQQQLRRAAPGTLGGRVQSPGSLQVRRPQLEKVSAAGGGGTGEGVFILSFTDSPLVASQLRPAYEHNGPDITLTYLYAKLDPAASSGTTTFKLYLNGSGTAFATLNIASGSTEGTTTFTQAITAGDEVVLVADPVGADIDYAQAQIGFES
jgi:hypothetical protein